MLLINVGETEFRYAKVTGGLVLIMKRGQMSLSMPLSFDELFVIMETIKREMDISNAKDFNGLTTSEIRKIAKRPKDRYKDE